MVLWKLKETCRVCLRKKIDMMSLTNGENYVQNVFSILSTLANFEITFNKVYPSFVCTQCYAKLKIFEDLKVVFDRTNKSLERYIVVKENDKTSSPPQNQVEEPESKIEIEEMILPETDLIKSDESNQAIEIKTEKQPREKPIRKPPRVCRWKKFENVSLEQIKAEIQKAQITFHGTDTTCLTCPFIAASPSILKNHVAQSHPELKDTWCLICNQIVADLETHYQNHFMCVFCKRSLSTRLYLLTHLRTTHIKFYFKAVEARALAQKTSKTKQKKVKEVKPVKVSARLSRSFPTEQVQAEIKRIGETFKGVITTCLKCDFVGDNLSALNAHVGHFHREIRNSWCPICNKIVNDRKQHLTNFHFKCKFCPKAFFTKANLIAHLHTHINPTAAPGEIPVFNCKICFKRFFTSELLATHEKVHKLLNLKCPYCSKMMRGHKGLKNHVNIVHELFACGKCKERFETDEELKQHNCDKRRKNYCKTCDKRVLSIALHNEQFHGVKREQSGEMCLCSICGKQLTTQRKLTEHMRMHTGEKPFPCTICDKSFTLRSSLLLHRRSHTGEKPYLCRFCGKAYQQGAMLKHHEEVHILKRSNFKCRICSKLFANASMLSFHMCTHFNRKHNCVVCGKMYMSRARLNIHLKVHDEDRPFKCNICQKGFKMKRSLKLHAGTHSAKKPYKCEMCSYASRQSASLTKHMKTHGVQPNPKC